MQGAAKLSALCAGWRLRSPTGRPLCRHNHYNSCHGGVGGHFASPCGHVMHDAHETRWSAYRFLVVKEVIAHKIWFWGKCFQFGRITRQSPQSLGRAPPGSVTCLTAYSMRCLDTRPWRHPMVSCQIFHFPPCHDNLGFGIFIATITVATLLVALRTYARVSHARKTAIEDG